MCSQGDNTSGSLLADTSRALTNLFSHTRTVTTWRCCIRFQLPIYWVILKGKNSSLYLFSVGNLLGNTKREKNMMHSFSIRQFVQQNPVSRVLWSNVWPHHYLWAFNVLEVSYEQYQHLIFIYISTFTNITIMYIQTQTISTMIWMFTKYINIY